MTSRNSPDSGITWKHADVRDMQDVPSKSVDLAFDKGTLDAMIHGSPWSPPDEVLDNTGRYVNEVKYDDSWWFLSLRRKCRCTAYSKTTEFFYTSHTVNHIS